MAARRHSSLDMPSSPSTSTLADPNAATTTTRSPKSHHTLSPSDDEKGNDLIAGEHDAAATTRQISRATLTAEAAEAARVAFPEGGLKAWLCVVGSFFCTFITFGYLNAFGVLEDYYLRVLPGYSSSTIAWIGSLGYFWVFFCGGFCGRLFDLGFLTPMFTFGCVLLVFSQMMLSLSHEFYQIFLAQGIGLGIAQGIVFNMAISAPTHHFNRRRGLAMGIMASGSSTGGTVFPILVRELIPRIGFGWTMRVIGFIAIAACAIAWFTLSTRIPPAIDVRDKEAGGWKQVRWFDLGAFKMPEYSIFVVGATLVTLGLYTPFTYMNVFSSYYHVPADGYYLSILNAASCFGRIVPGFVADHVGRINTVLPHLFISAILLFVYPLCSNLAGLLPFSIIFGAASGAYVSLVPACVAQMGITETAGTRIGMLFFVTSFGGLIGTPITGAILGSGEDLRWWPACIFSGSMVMAGAACIAVARWFALRRAFFGKI